MASLNQCNFIGNLGSDPDAMYTSSGTAITNISIACTETWKDKATGSKKEKTEWVRVTFFGALAEIAGKYLTKGAQVFISGRMQTEKYTDKNGIEKYSTKIVANEMKMLGSKGDSQPKQSGQGGFRNKPAEKEVTQADFADDEIPFN